MNELIKKAKERKPERTIQKVVSTKLKSKNEKQFSFYIEKELLSKLKRKALEQDRSLKSIIIESIQNYLDLNE